MDGEARGEILDHLAQTGFTHYVAQTKFASWLKLHANANVSSCESQPAIPVQHQYGQPYSSCEKTMTMQRLTPRL